ncbi:DUF3999 domain-containing protein [Desulfococcaceae bacterium HSG7]|nr:DUF3999 domain-containing protein [Desulfococcaceae bacterium HSG7]
MKIVMITLIVLIWSPAIQADSPRPDDFAFGYQLTVDSHGSLYKITLPEDIYQNVTRSDLGDLRVFNNYGEVVPHEIQRRQSGRAKATEYISLPFFPVFNPKGKSDTPLSMNFTTNAAGAIIMVTGKTDEDETLQTSAYLIDASHIKKNIKELELRWEGADQHFITTVKVSYSKDLTNWRTLVKAATLTEMQYGNHKLEQRTIALPLRKTPYLRLSWQASAMDVRLTSVRGEVLHKALSRKRRVITLSGVRDADNVKAYNFDSKGSFPTDRVNIRLPEINSLIQAVVKSRKNADAPWRVRCRGVFYNLRMNQTDLKNPVFSSALTTDRYWRLEILSDTGGMGNSTPLMELSWTPDDLIFLARGESPFILAFGSARIRPRSSTAHLLIEPLQNQNKSAEFIRPAQIKKRIELGGASRLTPLPPPVPWKQWLLWGILIAGVGFLGFMAWNLYQQMNRSGEKNVD